MSIELYCYFLICVDMCSYLWILFWCWRRVADTFWGGRVLPFHTLCFGECGFEALLSFFRLRLRLDQGIRSVRGGASMRIVATLTTRCLIGVQALGVYLVRRC